MKNLVFTIFFIIFLKLMFLQVTETADVFVSRAAGGKNENKKKNCGRDKDHPCQTINEAVKVAKANSHIKILASDNTVYNDCPIILTKPMVFIGEGMPVIDCKGKSEAFLIKFDEKKLSKLKDTRLIVNILKLKIQNATKGISFAPKNSKTMLQVSDVVFQDNAVDVNMKNSPLCQLNMNRVILQGISGDGIQFDSCIVVKMNLIKTKLLGKYFQVVSTKRDLQIDMSDVTVDMQTRSRSPKETRSPVHIETATNATSATRIYIKGTRFLNNAGTTNGSVTVESPQTIVKKKQKLPIAVIFTNVTFENNSVAGDGGAVWVDVWSRNNETKPAKVNFVGCTFRSNSAGFRGGALWLSSRLNKIVLFEKCNFHENRAYARDAGQGGAVFCTGGKITIKNSNFQGNSASKSGGTLHLEGDSSLIIVDSNFQNSNTPLNAIEGDVMFVDQKQTVFTGKNTFDLQSANFQKPIFIFKGRPRVLIMENSSTQFICPKGYNYEEIALDTKRIRKGVYHLFAFTCKPCQDFYYSVERGSQYINGSKYRAKCYKCPYGASCNGTIRAKANFWGMIQGDRVKMVACPRGYCCDREPCLSYDTCYSHRTGTVCGRCGEGFSEGISSTICHPNEECMSKSSWIWPLFCVVAILTFFLFQQEIITKLAKCLLWDENKNETNRPQSEIQDEDEENVEDEDEEKPRQRSERFSDNVQLSSHQHHDYNRIEESASFNNTGGYIKVFFYFYQIAFLLRVSSYSSQSSFPNRVIEFVVPFLNFQFSDEFTNCLTEDLTPVGKAYFKNSVCWCVLSLGAVLYLFYLVIRQCKFRSYTETGFEATSFPVRLTGAVMQIILQSYVALTLLTVQLLHCVELNGHHVLHIDGNVICYKEASQIFMWHFFVIFILPFPLVLIFGRGLLVSNHLSPGRFIFACFFPLFSLTYWGYLYCREGFGKRSEQLAKRNHYTDKILYILQYPYKSPASRDTVAEHLAENWESVCILRRLALVLAVVFADSILLRAHLLFFFSMVILLLHVAIQPFVNKRVNQCETVSLGVIVLFAGSDIAEAAFSQAGKAGPTSVAVVQALEDWIIAFLPFFILAAFLSPRAKSCFARLRRSRSLSFQSLQSTETDTPNPSC